MLSARLSMRGNESYCKRSRALRRCHQLSGSAIPRTEYLKITPISGNMHITEKEKASTTRPIHGVVTPDCI